MIPLARPQIGPDEVAAVVEVLESGILAAGPRVERFEDAFAAAVGVEHAVAVGSGTAALHVGLLAMGVGEGDEVVVPSFTFAGTANAVVMTGATPVFAEIDIHDYTIHADAVERLLSERTKAIMPVHLYGQPAPMAEILDLAEAAGVDVLEDAAQAHLAEVDGAKVGSLGRLAGFSFYPTKNMTTGEGGMITTSDSDVALRARWLRNQGMAERYVHRIVGLNERMTEIEAAIGIVQLARLPSWTARRRRIAATYRARLKPDLGVPVERPDVKHVYHQFTLCPQRREPVRSALDAAGIGHEVYYPRATHQQDPFVGSDLRLPVTEEVVDRVISIPVRPDLTDQEVEFIIETLNQVQFR